MENYFYYLSSAGLSYPRKELKPKDHELTIELMLLVDYSLYVMSV